MSYMGILHIEWLHYYQRHSLCTLELHERSDCWAMVRVIHHCVRILQAHVFIAICCATMHNKQNQCTLSLRTTHQSLALLPTTYRFIRVLLTSCTTHCSVFSINHVHYYLNYYYVLPYMYTLIHEFAAKQQKKEHKVGVKSFRKINYK